MCTLSVDPHVSPHGLPDIGISNTGKSPPESGGEGAGVTTGEGSGGALVGVSPETVAIFIFILVIITIANIAAKKYFTVVIALERVR